MAETYLKKRDFKQAETHYRQAVGFDAEEPRALTGLAWCIYSNPGRLEKERTAEAKKLLLEVLAKHKHGDASYELALLLRKAGDDAGARKRMSDAHRMDPSHVEASRDVRLFDQRAKKVEDERLAARGLFEVIGDKFKTK